MNLKKTIARLTLFLLPLLPLACHLADAPPGRTTMAITVDTALLRADRVVIVLKASSGTDTLFDGKLASLDTLQRLPAQGYDGGAAEFTIQGFQAGQLVYEEKRDYNGSTQSTMQVQIPIDRLHPPRVTSLDIRPDNVRLYVGGGTYALEAQPPEAWRGKDLSWSTGDPSVATVSQSGVLTPVHAGVTYVRASSGDTAFDASSVTVAVDAPALDFGSDTTVAAGARVSFQVKVTQEYGDVAAFAWDLDGDGKYEDSAAGTAGQTLFSTPAKAFPVTGDFQVRVRVRDGEGNVATASRHIKVGATAPAIDSLSATPATAVVGDTVRFSAQVSGGGTALKSFAWDFDGDGKFDQSGDLQGNAATLSGAFAYADEKTYKASLRITDAAGASVTGSIQVAVKLDRPKAHAGSAQSVAAGALVRLQGTGTDSSGTIVLREWKIGTGSFSTASDSGTVTFTAPTTPGVIACVFRVTNNRGLTDEETVLVTVNDSKAPTIPSFSPRDTTISIKDSVAFLAQAQATDADLKSYSFDPLGDGKSVSQGDLSGRSAALHGGHRYPDTGTYTVSLQVQDQAGKSASAQARVIVVLDPPKADAGKDTSLPVGGTVNLHGKASDGMGKVIRMEWKIGSGPFTVASKGDTSFQVPATAGLLPCVFRVMDDDSLTTTATVNVTVTPSGNADLSALAISSGALSPAFAAGTAAYTVSVANSVSSLTVTPTVATAGSLVKVNGAAVASGAASGAITLDIGSTAITVLVTAPDGITTKTYTIGVTRGSAPNADLAILALSAGTLSPVFAPATAAYTASVANAVSSLSVTAAAAAAGSAIKVNGVAVASGSASGAITLTVGSTIITVAVTAADGVTTKSYTVTVTRAAGADADLSALALSAGTLSPVFAPATIAYTATVSNATASLTVTPTVAGTGSTVKVNGTAVASATASGAVNLIVGANAISVVVTAQDGTTTKTYTITVTRAANVDATLSALVVSGATLSPAFASATIAYTATVANSVLSVTATPTASAAGSSIKVNGTAVASGTASGTLSLIVGTNAVTINVAAQDTSVKKTYTVTITRAPANADLSSLVPSSGSLSPAFSSAQINYADTVANGLANFSLTPTVAATGSTVVVNPGNHVVISGQSSPASPLIEGDNAFSVTVTSQDGTVNKTYNVTVNRKPPPLRLAYFVMDDSAVVHVSSSFASSGGAVTVTHAGVGLYTVVLNGMDDGTIARGAANVTPLGIRGGYCKTTGMTTTAAGLTTQVICFNSAGVNTDSKFSFALYPPRQAPFGYAEMRIASSPTFSPTVWYNSAGGTASARQADNYPTTHGLYNITFGKLSTAIGSADGILVTGLGTTTDHCAVGSSGMSVGGDYDALVECFPPGFATGTAYASFTVSITGPMPANGNMGLGYALVFPDGSTANATNSAGTVSVTHPSTGIWNLTFNGLGGVFPSRAGNVQVSPFNSSSLCSVNGWSGTANLATEVRCVDPNGNPSDETFSIWAVK
ncbi:MAG: cadherin-like beta sandwich domain-containing protein [Fibrobacteres bacterium]|nr:cadherin-like beta sandwich domain-containing protein [Fibrobacterota bacterium]